jgi:perosamine synthetase
MKNLRSLGFGKENKFLHESDGYNFRLSNIQAAVGVAQMKKVEKIIKMKRKVATAYNFLLRGSEFLEIPEEPEDYFSVFWMYTVKIKESAGLNAKELRDALAERGIESREGFVCYSDQFALHEQFGLSPNKTPISSKIQSRILYLPSSPKISGREISRVVREVNKIFNRQQLL